VESAEFTISRCQTQRGWAKELYGNLQLYISEISHDRVRQLLHGGAAFTAHRCIDMAIYYAYIPAGLG
jgi:hypothetical protein